GKRLLRFPRIPSGATGTVRRAKALRPSRSVPIYPRPGCRGAGDGRVRLRGAREERRPSKLAHPTEGERDRRVLAPRPRRRQGDRVSVAGGRRPGDAPPGGRGNALAIRGGPPAHLARTSLRVGIGRSPAGGCVRLLP